MKRASIVPWGPPKVGIGYKEKGKERGHSYPCEGWGGRMRTNLFGGGRACVMGQKKVECAKEKQKPALIATP